MREPISPYIATVSLLVPRHHLLVSLWLVSCHMVMVLGMMCREQEKRRVESLRGRMQPSGLHTVFQRAQGIELEKLGCASKGLSSARRYCQLCHTILTRSSTLT
eukprot:5767375-Amphidinium_carterae.1